MVTSLQAVEKGFHFGLIDFTIWVKYERDKDSAYQGKTK